MPAPHSARSATSRPRRLRSAVLLAGPALLFAAACGPHPGNAPSGPDAPGPPAGDTVQRPAGSGGVNAAVHVGAPYVVLVSFDGFRWDYMDRYDAPNFRRVAREGVRAEAMIPVFPSKTFPNHYSIATGMYADHHRLVGNTFWDAERGRMYRISDREVVEDGSWYGGEPIWVTAEKQGMVAASYYFVGSEADVGGVRPTFWRRYDGSVSRDERVDQVLEWLRLPAARRPHLVTMYFSDTDDVGHRYGPDSPEIAAAVGDVDASLGRLLDGIEALPIADRVYVVLVSDHGMLRAAADKHETLDPGLFPGVHFGEVGTFVNVYVDEDGPGRLRPLRDSLAALLPHAGVWLRDDVPARLHYSADPRVGDIVAAFEPEWTASLPGRVPHVDTYTHGWDNQVPEMGAIFLARGPGITPGRRIPAFENIHVYPFLAWLLGLEANPEIDGRLEVLRGVVEGG